MSSRYSGVVKWFDAKKGYGFIRDDQNGEDVFVHHRAIMVEGYRTLEPGQQVYYLRVRSEKGWQAAEVTLVQTGNLAAIL